MNTDKTMYWVALGVLALGLHSEYQTGRFPAIHRVADRAESTLCLLVTRAEQTFATAEILTGRVPQEVRLDDDFIARQQDPAERVMAEHQANLDRILANQQVHLDRAMALRQAHLDCLEQKFDRMHVALDRAQLQRMRAFERTRVKLSDAANRRMIVACPRAGVRIMLHTDTDLSDLDMNVPVIDVGNSF